MAVQHKSKCGEAKATSRFCAGGKLEEDTCKGDSGGGAFIGGEFYSGDPLYLIGIVSSGSRFCGSGKPRGFTRVTKYIRWIKNKLR